VSRTRFALPRRRPREEQVGDVGAGDEQDDAGARKLHPHHGGHHRTAHARRAPQLIQLHTAAGIFGVGLAQLAHDEVKVCLGALQRDPRLQPNHHFEPAIAADQAIDAARRRLHQHRHPEVEIQRSCRSIRCHAWATSARHCLRHSRRREGGASQRPALMAA
jgi:hypothetical protein